MKCIAIDDEPMALEVLEEYIQKVPFLELTGSFRDALSALEAIQQQGVDLIFLDVNMPDISGIDFLKSLLNTNLMVIFCTAYSEYALQSYDFEAIDYLLKPIDFDRFLKASLKAKKQYDYKHQTNKKAPSKERKRRDEALKDYLLIKSGNDICKINLHEIQYVEATGNYVKIVTTEKETLSLITMKEIQEMLPSESFIRIHKSFIVAFTHVKTVEKHQVRLESKNLPIGNVYRKQFFEWLEKK